MQLAVSKSHRKCTAVQEPLTQPQLFHNKVFRDRKLSQQLTRKLKCAAMPLGLLSLCFDINLATLILQPNLEEQD